jgi:hypothetical protein
VLFWETVAQEMLWQGSFSRLYSGPTSIRRRCSLTHPHLLEGRPKRKKNGCLLPTMRWREFTERNDVMMHDLTTQEEEKHEG